MAGPTRAIALAGRPPRRRKAATPASIAPAARPRQPACTAATTRASGSASSSGRQSAMKTASTVPVSPLTRPSASASCGLASGGPGPSRSRPASTTRAEWTWRTVAQGRPASPSTVARRRRPRSTARRSSPTFSPRLRPSYGGLPRPPARQLKAATTPRASRSSATSTGGQAGPAAAWSPPPWSPPARTSAAGGPGRQTSPCVTCSALEKRWDVEVVVIAVVGDAPGRLTLALAALFPEGALGRGARGTRAAGPDRLVALLGGGRGGGRGHGLGGPGRDLLAAVEAGRDDRHPDLVAEGVVDHRAEDDVGVGVGGRGDHLRRLVDLEQAQVGATGDVEQHAAGAVDRGLQQRRGDGLLGRAHRAV